ncbi:membrane protein [Desulfotomaculum defluvii]
MINQSNLGLVIRLVATYMGAIIGAGFASGQEILQFFILFGYKGLFGVMVATVFFVYLGAMVLRLSVQLRARNYQELLDYLLGPWAGKLMDLISIFMLMAGLAIMLSGTGAVVQEYLSLPEWIGIGLAVFIIILVILRGLNGFLSINVILVPIKLAAVCLIAGLALAQKGLPPELPYIHTHGVGGHWLLASILYVSYNMIVPMAVLSTTGRSITVKMGIWVGIIGGIGLGIAAAMVTLGGLAFYPKILNYEVPVLYMASCVSNILRPIFALLIWVAMLTTAIANTHGCASRFAPEGGKRYRFYGIASCLMVLPFTYFDFSFLVRLLYPIFGYAGLFLFGTLLIVPFIKNRK